ncbi:uncharacterized protein LOC126674917 isoform X2 [Mercurialis annua]|uniref:uncharacterized protein LOC126674917 isoform X2 n=1 Tax=Mercurialis annua TaxID=3986 RepID=UPI00215FCAF8|nr:uncharacterized protein LOC126674917 isoform X2 [Mercurialis annua]
MAESRKKPSEGIALLSMYSDEDDEDMEDLNHEPPQERGEEAEAEEAEQLVEGGAAADRVNDGGGDVMVTDEFGSNFNLNQNVRPQSRPPTPQEHPQAPVKRQQHARRSSRRGRLAIVDYAHDETAMSPELDEEEFDEELQIANGQENTPPGTVQILTPNIQATPQSSEHLETSQQYDVNDTGIQSEDAENEAATNVSAENIDALDKFLPPSPKEKCPEELRRKIEKFISLKKVGRSFNAEVRNRKDYRNPDFLLHAVRYQDIDQIGSCFSKDVFDPHGYDKSDFLDEIEADMRRERERKEQELKRSPKVEFISGGSQPGQVVPTSKFSMPISESYLCFSICYCCQWVAFSINCRRCCCSR